MAQNDRSNRVFLPDTPFRYFTDTRVEPTWQHLPYMLRGLISHGVTEIIVHAPDLPGIEPFRKYEYAFQSLPTMLRNHVLRFTRDDQCHKIVTELLRILFDELGFEPNHTLSGFTHDPGKPIIPNDLISSIMTLCATLKTFVGAALSRSQCDINISETIHHIDFISSEIKSGEPLGNLAIIKGILMCYTKVQHASLDCTENTSPDIVNIFNELLLDAEYRALATELHALGLRSDISTITRMVSILVQQVLQNRDNRRIFSLGTKIINVFPLTIEPQPV